ncbi:MAG: hypothetical protein RBS78_06015 [Coriobacteriia bacterium]|jgi:hypothetical protein|nr:hypothetical protein [Coriobacteriia bacterium]
MAPRSDAASLAELLSQDKEEIAARAATDEAVLKALFEALSGDKRAHRVAAARALHALAIKEPAALKGHGAELADALDRPEAQTRWEILGALEKVVNTDGRIVDKAIAPATTALHDAESGVVRLAAFRLLAAYGATTSHRSEKVWPVLSEAVRVYHGDPEFPAMLIGLIRLVSGNAADSVKIDAAERMSFDAENAKGLIGQRARRIVACAPKKGRSARKA